MNGGIVTRDTKSHLFFILNKRAAEYGLVIEDTGSVKEYIQEHREKHKKANAEEQKFNRGF